MTKEEIFKHTIVLSLEHRYDRRDFITKTMDKMNISFDFFNAINGHETFNPTNLLNGEYGIKLSHIEIMKYCKQNNFSGILIFEDDVVFCDDFYEKLNKNLLELPLD
jgi:GR25 family glycosyltransferase involved in LPS biosynthesis